MPHLHGPKLRGKHTTLTEPAFDLCKFLMSCEYVDGVKYGTITPRHASRPKMKLETQQASIKLDISGPGAMQIILVYCNEEHLAQTKELIEQKWQDLHPYSGKKTKVHNKPKAKNHQLINKARQEAQQIKLLERRLEREQTSDEPEDEPKKWPAIDRLFDYCMTQRLPDPVFRFTVRRKPNGKCRYSCQVVVELPSGQVSASSGMQSSRIQAQGLACQNLLRNLQEL